MDGRDGRDAAAGKMSIAEQVRGRGDSRAGCRVQGAGCRVQGAGCRVQGAGCSLVPGAPAVAEPAGRLALAFRQKSSKP